MKLFVSVSSDDVQIKQIPYKSFRDVVHSVDPEFNVFSRSLYKDVSCFGLFSRSTLASAVCVSYEKAEDFFIQGWLTAGITQVGFVDIATEKAFRGTGLGSRLLKYAIAKYRRPDTLLLACVSKTNTSSLSMLRRFGKATKLDTSGFEDPDLNKQCWFKF